MTNPRPLTEVVSDLIEKLKEQNGYGLYEAELAAEEITGGDPMPSEEEAA